MLKQLISVCSIGLPLVLAACGSDDASAPEAGSGGSGASGGAAGGSGGATGGSGGTNSGGTNSGGAGGAGGTGAAAGSGSGGAGGSAGGTGISQMYPGDQNIASHPSVIFHSDFENGMSGWTSYTQNTARLDVDQGQLAHAGSHYLRASVTRTMLATDQYISAQARFKFPQRVPTAYWRFYTHFVANSATPHHWVRMAAGDANYSSDGLAATVPPGDQGYWFDLDAKEDGSFSFYTYWHEMRSWMCNDGSTDSNCAGYNGPSSTPYYGNNFNPGGQTPFPRDQWFCVEVMTKSNTPGSYDGELALYVNDALVGEYRTGTPRGRWLRDSFYSHGQYFQDQQGFDGFNFRTSPDVGLKFITLDAYYERGSLNNKEANGQVVPEAQTILYDDVVVATERIGCQVP